MKPRPPLSSETAVKTAPMPQRGWVGFHVGAGMKPRPPLLWWVGAGMKPRPPLLWWVGVYVKPEPPLSSENAPKTAYGLQRGWSGFHVGVGTPQQGWSRFHGGAGVLQPGWFGFHPGACMKPEAPLPSETAVKTAHGPRQGWSGFQRGACVKPEAPLPSEIAPQAARIVQRGWFGFQRGRGLKPGPPLCGLLWACVKPEAPVPVPWRLGWGVLAKRGWSGFQRARAHRSQGGLGFTWASPTAPATRPSQPRPPVAHGSTRIRPAARWAGSPPTGRWAGRAGPRSPAPARCHSRAERPRRPETRR